jgi:hypothetical protein
VIKMSVSAGIEDQRVDADGEGYWKAQLLVRGLAVPSSDDSVGLEWRDEGEYGEPKMLRVFTSSPSISSGLGKWRVVLVCSR